MTYEAWSSFAQTWGLAYFVAIFVVAIAYAFWPSNRATFKRASRLVITEKERGDDRPLA
jgi:cytochrome c oxidase cbb3-type subunit 4